MAGPQKEQRNKKKPTTGAGSALASDFNTYGSYGALWSHGPRRSTQTQATVGPRTQTWPSATDRAWMSPRPGVSAGHPHQYGPGGSMALRYQHDLWWLTRPQVCVASSGHTGHEHQPSMSLLCGLPLENLGSDLR